MRRRRMVEGAVRPAWVEGPLRQRFALPPPRAGEDQIRSSLTKL